MDAVIKAIASVVRLHSYLEGKANLTLPTLRRILRSHYQENGATELHKQLTLEVQSCKETPQSFLICVVDLQQMILFASQESKSSLRYYPAPVQCMFLHSVLTGLQNYYIRMIFSRGLMNAPTAVKNTAWKSVWKMYEVEHVSLTLILQIFDF